MGSVIPDPALEEERGDTAGPPSAPMEGDKLEPDPVEPGEVVGTPVSCNQEMGLEVCDETINKINKMYTELCSFTSPFHGLLFEFRTFVRVSLGEPVTIE